MNLKKVGASLGIIIGITMLFSVLAHFFTFEDILAQGLASGSNTKLITLTGEKIRSSLTTTASNPDITVQPEHSIGLPMRLMISKLNINATILHLGLTLDGAMEVPKGPAEVSWFNLGPRPGEQGSAVLAGHFGVWKNGKISVFHDLHTLRTGDIVAIEDSKGIKVSFLVTKIKHYNKDADASEVFISRDGISRLNLITCIWDKVSKSYSKRLVVFTEKITTPSKVL